MPSLGEVIRRHGDAYLKRYRGRMLPSHERALRDIRNCRTEVLGGHLYRCAHCGQDVYAYHSCKNRHCPQCHREQTAAWIEKRRHELLPVPYFHVVFTVPQELHALCRSHQKAAYGALLYCAAHALMKLCHDPKYLGGEIGVMAILHTWTRNLAYHPHVHCLVPAGGLTPDGCTWRAARKNFLVPARALSKIFRGMLRDALKKALPGQSLPQRAFRRRQWVAYLRTAPDSAALLEYLARYVHRVAIADRHILRVTDHEVAFRYQDNKTRTWHTMTLAPESFLHRFLQHVLPQGFQKVRYFGLWHSSKRHILRQLRLLLPPPTSSPTPEIDPSPSESEDHHTSNTCPYCRQKSLVYIRPLPRCRPPRRRPP